MLSSRSKRKLTNPTGLPAAFLAIRKLREKGEGKEGREKGREREREKTYNQEKAEIHILSYAGT